MRTDDKVEHEHEAQEVVHHEVDHHQLIMRPELTGNRAALRHAAEEHFPHHFKCLEVRIKLTAGPRKLRDAQHYEPNHDDH